MTEVTGYSSAVPSGLVRWIFLFTALILCSCHTEHVKTPTGITVFISAGVFDRDPTIKQIIATWQDYLNSRPDSAYDNPYWNEAEKRRYPGIDLLNGEFTPSLYLMTSTYTPSVLSVTPVDGYYKIRTLFAAIQDSVFVAPLAITEVYAKKQDTVFKLYNALPIKTRDWQHTTIGSITFIYPKSHTFDQALADKLMRFVDTLAQQFTVPPIPVDYYFNDDIDELKHAQGFDYFMGEGNERAAAGKADPLNHIVYGAMQGEYFPHEFVHIYTFPKYHNSDAYFDEGLATLLGGSRGHSLDWNIVRADSLLDADTTLNIDTIMSQAMPTNLDYIVGSNYVIGGLICRVLMEKGGWPLVLKFGEYPSDDGQARFKAIKELLSVERRDAARYIRKKIRDEAVIIRSRTGPH